MKKPYIICHMMTSIDGRIDCTMTAKLSGVEDYYKTLELLNSPSTVSGRVTAELELALPGKFEPKEYKRLGKEAFSKKGNADGYEIITDAKGTLLWPDVSYMEKPYLIITSEQVSTEHLNYLDDRNISWIACGEEKIDLVRASKVLLNEFSVQRMAVVGGPIINIAFLDAGLLDEVSPLIGAGIDGRGAMPPVFDGLEIEHKPIPLKLRDVEKFDNGVTLSNNKIGEKIMLKTVTTVLFAIAFALSLAACVKQFSATAENS